MDKLLNCKCGRMPTHRFHKASAFSASYTYDEDHYYVNCCECLNYASGQTEKAAFEKWNIKMRAPLE